MSSDRARPSGRDRARVAAVVLTLGLVCLAWVSRARGGFDGDEGVYAQTAAAVAAGSRLGSQVFSSQPPLLPYLLLPAWQLTHSVYGLRLFCALVAAGAVAATASVVAPHAGRGRALAAAALVALCPAFVLVAPAVQGEGPSLALALSAVALVSRPRTPPARAAVSGVLLGAALMVKLLIAPYAVGTLALLLLDRTTPPTSRARAAAWHAVGASAVVLGCGAVFWAHGTLLDQAVLFHVTAQESAGAVGLGLLDQLQAQPVLAVLLVLGAAAAVRGAASGGVGLALALWLGACCAALALHTPLFAHHLSLLAAPAAVALVVGAPPALPRAVGLAGLGALLVAGALARPWSGYAHPGTGPGSVVALLRTLPPGSSVVSDDQVLATLADLRVPPDLVDTSAVRYASGLLDEDEVCRRVRSADVVVLSSVGRFAQMPGVERCAVQAGLTPRQVTGPDRVYGRDAPGPTP